MTTLTAADVADELRREILKRDDPVPLLVLVDMLGGEDVNTDETPAERAELEKLRERARRARDLDELSKILVETARLAERVARRIRSESA